MRTLRPRHFYLAMASAVALSACGRDAPGRSDAASDLIPEAERFGGTAVAALMLDLQSMNSLTSNETYSRMVQREVLFMPLLKYDEKLEAMPWLAEQWDTVRVAPDTLELTFHLRGDVRWHDGTPTAAEDVRFTYQRVKDASVGSSIASSFAHYGPHAEVVDASTIRFRLRPHAEFLDGWTELAIMPRHILGEVPPDRLAQHPFGTSQPVGNGPFRFVRRTPGQEWVFEANPDFPEALGGRPYLDRLVFRAIPEATTLLIELQTGGVHVYMGVRTPQAPLIAADPNSRLLSAPSPSWAFIAWNSRLPLFETPEVRRALSMGIDRHGIVQALLDRSTVTGRSPVTPVHWAFDAEDPQTSLPHDPEAAKRLLAQAGWTDRNGDGLLEDAQSRPFRFSLLVPQGNDTGRDVAQIIQAQLRTLGIDVRPSSVEGNTLIGQITGRVNPRGERERNFEAVMMGWTDSHRKDDTNLFHSRNLNGPFQIAGYSNPRVDVLLDTLGLILDRGQARPLWKEYQSLLTQDAPMTVLYYPNRLAGVNRRLQGVEVDARGELVSVARWWISPEQRGRTDAP
jgi:peptide/nickel transport system substrate-binding protein